jgi:hypothetical protein
VSSGRTFSIKTAGKSGAVGLLDLTANIGNAESTPDRWAINVINTDSTNAIKVGRTGIACIPLAAGVAYRFEGCALRDVTIDDAGTQVVVAVDASDTVKERLSAMQPLQPIQPQIIARR